MGNSVANALKTLGAIILVISVLSGFYIESEYNEIGFAIVVGLLGTASGMITFGLGEIVEILHDIRSSKKKTIDISSVNTDGSENK